ncbi:MAG: sigma-54-dependent Fis family transcriptional regulator [Deltaproteobacteria bacterium]|nr:sigma-54-dependent Fis family transcriptional regulator [Deltaproteobacteria bacterium]
MSIFEKQFSGKHRERVEAIDAIINNNNFNKSKVKTELNKKFKEWIKKGEVGEGYDLITAGFSYLTYALGYKKYEDRPKAKEGKKAFEEIFFEVFERGENLKIKKWTCHFALAFMGLDDLSSYSYLKNVDNEIQKVIKEGKPIGIGIGFGSKNELEDKIFNYSRLNIPLLIVGETGTSKGLLARAIHRMSERRKAPYKEINCIAIPENLIESELFGYRKGAFTGANADKPGVIETANDGTLLLDELGKMPRSLQAKLLKVIEDKEFYPVGSNNPVKIDVRFLATLHPGDVETLYPDLLWRFSWPICIELPTLSDRLKILEYTILENSLGKVLAKMNIKNFSVSHNACKKLIRRDNYPGNYRELENILLLAILSAMDEGRDEIIPQDISFNNMLNDKKTEQLNDIRLIDIVEYADKEASKLCASIIKGKIDGLKDQGKDIKNTLISEGLSKKKYPTYLKQMNSRLRKNSHMNSS